MLGIVHLLQDSALGRWSYWEWRPRQLAAVAELLWQSQGTVTRPRKRILPNGKLELLVNLGPPIRLAEGAGADRFVGGTLSGLQCGPLVIEMVGGHTHVLGVRLTPAGAYALLGRPMGELGGLTVGLDDLVGRAAAELAERCDAAPSVEERFRIAARWITRQILGSPRVEPAIAYAAAQLERSAGAVPIARLRDELGLSKTRLAARFRDQIGVTPKRYARILRFHRLVPRLHAREGDLAALALAAGYYDQAHMTAEFRALSGLTPGEFLASARYAQTIAVAEPG
jgi:AraC-like DNA-binding protein